MLLLFLLSHRFVILVLILLVLFLAWVIIILINFMQDPRLILWFINDVLQPLPVLFTLRLLLVWLPITRGSLFKWFSTIFKGLQVLFFRLGLPFISYLLCFIKLLFLSLHIIDSVYIPGGGFFISLHRRWATSSGAPFWRREALGCIIASSFDIPCRSFAAILVMAFRWVCNT